MKGEDILKLIPQREPVVMIDCFFGIEENVSYSGLTITADLLFCEGGLLQECGIIEHIAQSAAARIGYICRCVGEMVPLGFIGSLDRLTIYFLPQVGMEIRTEIRVEQEIFDITLISAKVMAGERLVADGRMKIFLKTEA